MLDGRKGDFQNEIGGMLSVVKGYAAYRGTSYGSNRARRGLHMKKQAFGLSIDSYHYILHRGVE